ncbi:unnamed protein product [Heligmosomoides polygyrus]|uniref:Regulatory protein zeste n=1 Tax=Heligmosomoides polygyrus TaxID=6339 RepID=A0A183F400_HELPZ|nr:unnamed protein product [Heligmosomoides polygyrus]
MQRQRMCAEGDGRPPPKQEARSEAAKFWKNAPVNTTVLKELAYVVQQSQKEQTAKQEKLMQWQTSIDNKKDALMKTKTWCSLTKVDVVNTIRKEFTVIR